MTRYDHRPPGKLVDVGGYRLHILCRGHGHPTVVMDSALGGFASDWSLVEQKAPGITSNWGVPM